LQKLNNCCYIKRIIKYKNKEYYIVKKKNYLLATISLFEDYSILSSVIVGLGFNPIELTRPTLILGSGKFPSPTGWNERRMRVECLTRPIQSRDVT